MLLHRARDCVGDHRQPGALDDLPLLTRAPFFLLLGEFPSTLLLELIDAPGSRKKGAQPFQFLPLLTGAERCESKREGLSDPYARPKEPVWLRCTLWKKAN